jgi:hypothetical protein
VIEGTARRRLDQSSATGRSKKQIVAVPLTEPVSPPLRVISSCETSSQPSAPIALRRPKLLRRGWQARLMTKTLLLVILAGAAAACSTAFAAPETGQVGKPLELGGTKVDEQPIGVAAEPEGLVTGHELGVPGKPTTGSNGQVKRSGSSPSSTDENGELPYSLGALIVSVVALLVAGMTSWQSAFRPAELDFEWLETSSWASAGGTDGVPAASDLVLQLALSNLGARAGLLLRSFRLESVLSPGALAFATGNETFKIELDGAPGWPGSLPRTVEPGEVRLCEVTVKLSGALKTAIEAAESETTPTPELKPLAEMLNELQRVDLEFKWDYDAARHHVGRDSGRGLP